MRQRDWLTWMLGRLGHPLISAAHHRMDTCGTGNGTVFAIATALRLWPTMITLRHRAGSRVLPVSANANVSYGCCEPGVRMHVVWGIASFSGPQRYRPSSQTAPTSAKSSSSQCCAARIITCHSTRTHWARMFGVQGAIGWDSSGGLPAARSRIDEWLILAGSMRMKEGNDQNWGFTPRSLRARGQNGVAGPCDPSSTDVWWPVCACAFLPGGLA